MRTAARRGAGRGRYGALFLLACAASSMGCATAYKPPTAQQPHATFKVRRSYGSFAGTHLREHLSIDGHDAFADTTDVQSVSAPRTDAVLAHPTTAEVRLDATFFHTEMRTVQEAYTVQIPYSTTESYSCGTGSSFRMCTRSVTHYRSETRYRTVVRPVAVTDAACGSALWITPDRDHNYILDYSYSDNGVCRLACFEQVPTTTPGMIESRACAPPSPAAIRKSLAAR